MKTHPFTVNRFLNMLSFQMLVQACILLYRQQTKQEQNNKQVDLTNGKGFSHHTVNIGTAVATWALARLKFAIPITRNAFQRETLRSSHCPGTHAQMRSIAAWHHKQLISLGILCPDFSTKPKELSSWKEAGMVLDILALDPFQYTLAQNQIDSIKARRKCASQPFGLGGVPVQRQLEA